MSSPPTSSRRRGGLRGEVLSVRHTGGTACLHNGAVIVEILSFDQIPHVVATCRVFSVDQAANYDKGGPVNATAFDGGPFIGGTDEDDNLATCSRVWRASAHKLWSIFPLPPAAVSRLLGFLGFVGTPVAWARDNGILRPLTVLNSFKRRNRGNATPISAVAQAAKEAATEAKNLKSPKWKGELSLLRVETKNYHQKSLKLPVAAAQGNSARNRVPSAKERKIIRHRNKHGEAWTKAFNAIVEGAGTKQIIEPIPDAEVNGLDEALGLTLLSAAVHFKAPTEVLTALIAKGARVVERVGLSASPLHAAAKRTDSAEPLAALLKARAETKKNIALIGDGTLSGVTTAEVALSRRIKKGEASGAAANDAIAAIAPTIDVESPGGRFFTDLLDKGGIAFATPSEASQKTWLEQLKSIPPSTWLVTPSLGSVLHLVAGHPPGANGVDEETLTRHFTMLIQSTPSGVIRSRDIYGNSILHVAVNAGNEGIIAAIIASAPTLLAAENQVHRTALQIAVERKSRRSLIPKLSGSSSIPKMSLPAALSLLRAAVEAQNDAIVTEVRALPGMNRFIPLSCRPAAADCIATAIVTKQWGLASQLMALFGDSSKSWPAPNFSERGALATAISIVTSLPSSDDNKGPGMSLIEKLISAGAYETTSFDHSALRVALEQGFFLRPQTFEKLIAHSGLEKNKLPLNTARRAFFVHPKVLESVPPEYFVQVLHNRRIESDILNRWSILRPMLSHVFSPLGASDKPSQDFVAPFICLVVAACQANRPAILRDLLAFSGGKDTLWKAVEKRCGHHFLTKVIVAEHSEKGRHEIIQVLLEAYPNICDAKHGCRDLLVLMHGSDTQRLEVLSQLTETDSLDAVDIEVEGGEEETELDLRGHFYRQHVKSLGYCGQAEKVVEDEGTGKLKTVANAVRKAFHFVLRDHTTSCTAGSERHQLVVEFLNVLHRSSQKHPTVRNVAPMRLTKDATAKQAHRSLHHLLYMGGWRVEDHRQPLPDGLVHNEYLSRKFVLSTLSSAHESFNLVPLIALAAQNNQKWSTNGQFDYTKDMISLLPKSFKVSSTTDAALLLNLDTDPTAFGIQDKLFDDVTVICQKPSGRQPPKDKVKLWTFAMVVCSPSNWEKIRPMVNDATSNESKEVLSTLLVARAYSTCDQRRLYSREPPRKKTFPRDDEEEEEEEEEVYYGRQPMTGSRSERVTIWIRPRFTNETLVPYFESGGRVTSVNGVAQALALKLKLWDSWATFCSTALSDMCIRAAVTTVAAVCPADALKLLERRAAPLADDEFDPTALLHALVNRKELSLEKLVGEYPRFFRCLCDCEVSSRLMIKFISFCIVSPNTTHDDLVFLYKKCPAFHKCDEKRSAKWAALCYTNGRDKFASAHLPFNSIATLSCLMKAGFDDKAVALVAQQTSGFVEDSQTFEKLVEAAALGRCSKMLSLLLNEASTTGHDLTLYNVGFAIDRCVCLRAGEEMIKKALAVREAKFSDQLEESLYVAKKEEVEAKKVESNDYEDEEDNQTFEDPVTAQHNSMTEFLTLGSQVFSLELSGMLSLLSTFANLVKGTLVRLCKVPRALDAAMREHLAASWRDASAKTTDAVIRWAIKSGSYDVVRDASFTVNAADRVAFAEWLLTKDVPGAFLDCLIKYWSRAEGFNAATLLVLKASPPTKVDHNLLSNLYATANISALVWLKEQGIVNFDDLENSHCFVPFGNVRLCKLLGDAGLPAPICLPDASMRLHEGTVKMLYSKDMKENADGEASDEMITQQLRFDKESFKLIWDQDDEDEEQDGEDKSTFCRSLPTRLIVKGARPTVAQLAAFSLPSEISLAVASVTSACHGKAVSGDMRKIADTLWSEIVLELDCASTDPSSLKWSPDGILHVNFRPQAADLPSVIDERLLKIRDALSFAHKTHRLVVSGTVSSAVEAERVLAAILHIRRKLGTNPDVILKVQSGPLPDDYNTEGARSRKRWKGAKAGPIGFRCDKRRSGYLVTMYRVQVDLSTDTEVDHRQTEEVFSDENIVRAVGTTQATRIFAFVPDEGM